MTLTRRRARTRPETAAAQDQVQAESTDPEAVRLRSLFGFWNAVEVLSHFPVPSPRRDGDVVAIRGDADLPWPEPKRSGPDAVVVWHIVYLGIHPYRDVAAKLLEHFHGEDDPASMPSRDECCLASFVVDQVGVIVPGSAVLASHSWAMGQLADNPRLTGFPQAESSYRQRFADRHGGADPCDAETLEKEIAAVEAMIGWRPDDAPRAPLAYARRVIRRKRKMEAADQAVRPESDLLSSFYLRDLSRLAGAAQDPGSMPQGLRTYLSTPTPGERRDVRLDRAAIAEQIRPQCFPAGRWPQPDGHHLVLMQQVAVNRALGPETADSGLFSVNGPPGTGKTTLLRDIVAALVVERARVMLSFNRPASAFKPGPLLVVGDAARSTYRIHPRLRGFEILVASSNNGAVENVTRELPRLDAVDSVEVGEGADPFAHHATRLAKERDGDAAQAWGLIAGVLGNKDNRDRFRETLWFGSDSPLRDELLLRPSASEWKEAQQAFRVAQEQERWHRERAIASALLADVPVLRAQLRRSEDELLHLEEAVAAAATAAETAGAGCRDLAEAASQRERALDVVRARRPPSAGTPRPAAQQSPWELALAEAERAYREALDHRDRALAEAREKVVALQDLREATKHQRTEVEAKRAEIDAIEAKAGIAADPRRVSVGDRFWELDEDARQLTLPWSTPSWERARAQLFVAALRLHRAFIRSAGDPVGANLAAAMDVLRQPPQSADLDALESVWSTLFLLVPVLSTTFASASRMLHGMGPASIGWVLIDEAGQASPQQAAGTIWRARRTIAIGDPLQIPPIENTPLAVLRALRAEWKVEDRWEPGMASVQTVADAVNPLGTSLASTWVGCPLRVHRRCAEPMFSISNHIAYDGIMVSATAPRVSVIGELMGDSRWIDIAGVPGAGHQVEAQAEMVERILRRLTRTLTLDQLDLYVISPFRLMASGLRARLRPLGDDAWGRWVRDRVGTIHTAQGKEAEAVILALGGDPARRGALLWAGATPNILNVAVTRAKEHLYVVGDAVAWASVPHFRDLHARLRIVVPSGGR